MKARSYSSQFQAAVIPAASAREDVAQARDQHKAMFAQAAAQAKQQIATCGLVATVVRAYYGMISAQRRLVNANWGVSSARGAYYPSLMPDYFFGIDANIFAVRGPDDRKKLGSVVQGTVDIPVWNWEATRQQSAPG